MTGNQQNHLLVLLGAFQETKRELVETKRELVESRRKVDISQTKLQNTSLKPGNEAMHGCAQWLKFERWNCKI